MKAMRGFEFERGIDTVQTLTMQQLLGLINKAIDRNFTSVVAHHMKKSVLKIEDRAELDVLAEELVELDAKNQTNPLFVVYYEDDKAADKTLTERFMQAVENSVIGQVEKARSTTGGSRTPVTKAPATTYRQVASSTRPGHMHTVRLVGGVPVECSCEGFFYNQKCKHLRMFS